MNFVYGKEIIFGATIERAFAKLEEIHNEILESNEEYVIRKTRYYVETNLRKITATSVNNSSRGYRCSKAYVDVDTSIRVLHYVIYPCMSLYYGGKTLQNSIEYFNY